VLLGVLFPLYHKARRWFTHLVPNHDTSYMHIPEQCKLLGGTKRLKKDAASFSLDVILSSKHG
jgi:hypothetical protein